MKSNFLVITFAFASISTGLFAQAGFQWQEPHARVLPTGELEYTPQPFEFVAGESVRYVDFERGDDANPGTKAAPWKRHPWDPASSGQAKAAANDLHTYIFKGGVTYRGHFVIPESVRGKSDEPIRLTRDPSWGDGPAVINGAEVVTGWTRDSHAKMPEGEKVWATEVDFLPRTLWLTKDGHEPIRMKLARWPNWEESEPNDLMAEWPTWDQPKWWEKKATRNTEKVSGTVKHIGIANTLPRPLEDLVGGTVWTEWGIVMGSPYPAEIEAVAKKFEGINFRGPWTYHGTEKIITGNRYYLEDLPQFLDEPGEFWVEKIGRDSGRIYVRLPNDVDPNRFTLEAGRHHNIFEGTRFDHIHWRGLTFRFGNVRWNYNHPRWAHDQEIAAIHLNGSGDGILIANNTFEHLPMPIRISVGSPQDAIGTVRIVDNRMADTDHGAAYVENTFPKNAAESGHLGHVDFLRNQLERIGMRIISGEHGHAVDIRFPDTSHTAGNFLNRIAGWGLAVFGGKPSGRKAVEIPLSRHLIHHNRVEDVLLKSNDWGGIETWQGGSHYVFNNIVINALGFKNWKHVQNNPEKPSSFGHAYYADGSFKNYLFNNIGLGLNNDIAAKGHNITAIQNIISFENWYFNNSFHKFVEATRQQAPSASRFRYLGNVFSDVSKYVFRHANPKDGEPDPNAAHYTQGGDFDYPTLAYVGNVFYDISGKFGVFEETGTIYDRIDGFRDAMVKLETQNSEVGIVTSEPPLQDPSDMDWRPVPGSAATQENITVFVPWALARPVGEWQFALNQADPAEIVDEHWFMTTEYNDRTKYMDTPRYPLMGTGIDASNFVEGPLANWTKTALQLNGQDEYLKIAHSTLPRRGEATVDAGDFDKSSDGMKETALPFGTLRHPATVQPGKTHEVVLDLDKPYPGQQPGLHIHWMKSDGWGGFSSITRPKKVSNTRYTIEVTPEEHGGAASYNLLPYLSADGNWNTKTQNASVNVGIAATEDSNPAADGPEGPWSINILDSSMIVEAILTTSDSNGLIASKMADGVGYELTIEGGSPVFRVATDQGSSASVTAADSTMIGGWKHLIAELDRENEQINLYLDGALAASTELPGDFAGSLGNNGDFLVGGSPNKEPLAATVDFLRVNAASLAESKTTAEEIRAWQINGPQYQDFAGHDRREQNAAGALAR